MKKYLQNLLLITTVILMYTACNDPVFFALSKEVEPIVPKIKGRPTNILELGGDLYTASGNTIYKYTGSSWNSINSPGGTITHLAKDATNLYALSDSKVMRLNGSGSWENLGSGYNSLYGTGNAVFAGKGDSISYVNGSALAQLTGATGELCGAAYDGTNNYIITKEKGAYYTTAPSASTASLIANSNGIPFAGIIGSSNTIISIERNGQLYKLDTSSASNAGLPSLGTKTTGALAVWKDSNDPTLLLAGRYAPSNSGISFSYGYMELELNSNGTIKGTAFREPGTGSPTSVIDKDRFASTLGMQPVHSIMQSTATGILFASTQKNGLWSYRERSNEKQWNAEDY